MAPDFANRHGHDLDAEYLHPVDAKLLSIRADGEGLVVRVAVACPECGETLELRAPVAAVEESDLDLPLEDPEEAYD